MENYLVHHGVKGMKWGVRKDPRVVKASNKRKKAGSAYTKAQDKLAINNLKHPSSMFYKSKNYSTYNNLSTNLNKARDAYNKASKEYYDTKALVKNEKQVSKYSSQARTQRNYNAKSSLNFEKNKGRAYFDDEELWDISSKEDKARYNDMAKKSAIATRKIADHWDKAISDIDKTKNKQEAKAVFEKYKNVRGNWYVYTSDPGDKYFEQMRNKR